MNLTVHFNQGSKELNFENICWHWSVQHEQYTLLIFNIEHVLESFFVVNLLIYHFECILHHSVMYNYNIFFKIDNSMKILHLLFWLDLDTIWRNNSRSVTHVYWWVTWIWQWWTLSPESMVCLRKRPCTEYMVWFLTNWVSQKSERQINQDVNLQMFCIIMYKKLFKSIIDINQIMLKICMQNIIRVFTSWIFKS